MIVTTRLSLIAGSVLQYRRNAERGRRLDDKSRVAIEHSHSGNDAGFLNQRDVVGHGQQVVKDRRDRAAAGDSIGDRVDAVGLDDGFCPPRQRHRRRAPWLHANDLDLWGQAFEHMTHARRHGAASERNEHGVYRTPVLDEFEPDRPGAFTGIEVFAVLNQKRAFDLSDLPRQMASIFKVALDNPHGRAQGADTFQLVRLAPAPATTVTAIPRLCPL